MYYEENKELIKENFIIHYQISKAYHKEKTNEYRLKNKEQNVTMNYKRNIITVILKYNKYQKEYQRKNK